MSLITVTTSGLLSLHIRKIRNSAHRHVSINAARREKAAKKLPVTSILDVKHLSVDSYRFFLIFKKTHHIISKVVYFLLVYYAQKKLQAAMDSDVGNGPNITRSTL